MSAMKRLRALELEQGKVYVLETDGYANLDFLDKASQAWGVEFLVLPEGTRIYPKEDK